MKEIIEKLSSYNIFNYLFPGVVFAILATKFTDLNLTFDNLFLGAFAYYFIGLVISRFGSVFIEPLLKLIRIVKFADYKDFVTVSKSDNKLEILSEANNMYRTLVSMFSLLFLTFGFKSLADKWEFLKNNQDIILLTFLFFLFLLSYRKQTNYITKRIKALK
ncbi:MAG TPA: hypothetical protein VMV77_21430 [Bacteroidales bacterium]|nr:hypothetical protein [Bacteroidales bacterium]